MLKKITLVLALMATVFGGVALAQDRPISGGLPWDNAAAEPVLQQRMDTMFPDGTPVAKLNDALAAERFSMVSDNRGSSTPTGDGNRYASRGVARFIFGCSTRVALNWRQEGGRVYDIESGMHQGCL